MIGNESPSNVPGILPYTSRDDSASGASFQKHPFESNELKPALIFKRLISFSERAKEVLSTSIAVLCRANVMDIDPTTCKTALNISLSPTVA